MKTILALFFALALSVSAQSNVTVTVTLTPAQAAWLADNAATNIFTANEILQRQLLHRLDQEVAMREANDAAKIAELKREQMALKSFRTLTTEQQAISVAIISGRKLTDSEKAIVKAIAEKVLAE